MNMVMSSEGKFVKLEFPPGCCSIDEESEHLHIPIDLALFRVETLAE